MSEPDSKCSVPAPTPKDRRSPGRRYGFLLLIGVVLVAASYYAYRLVVSSAAKLACKENLHKLGIAMHAYHDRYGSFPPALVKGTDGKPAHSWRVLLLPFLGRQDLYDAYHFDEPWNSPNNLRLAEPMPDVFACPSGAGQGKTSYVAVVGSQTAWPGDRAIKIADITDGTSNTILLIEIANSDIGWTEPRDVWKYELLPPDGDEISARFASGHAGIVNVLFCDGSVRAIQPSRIGRKVLYSLLAASGGQPYQGKWLPGEDKNTDLPIGDFPAEQNAEALSATEVLPHLAGPLQADRNSIYCATFQLAWDDFRHFVGGNPLLEGRPSMAAALNGPAFPRSALSPTSYVARMGLVSEGIRDKIAAEMAEKFPGVTPSLSGDAGPGDFVAYAYLQKNLPFQVRFDRVVEPLVFHGAAGDVKVEGFGFKELASASGDTDKLWEQVNVLYYQSDEEFVLRLRPKTDEIVLAKIRPRATLGETLRTVQELIGRTPKPVDRPQLNGGEELLVPRLRFNVLRRYGELTDRHLENSGKEDWRILKAEQVVRFLLNESGARLESEAVLEAALDSMPLAPPPPPRHFVLDRPFLLYLKEATAEQPYLVIWVANAELMERR